MSDTTADAVRRSHPLWIKVLAGVVAAAVLLVLLVIFFPWDVLRGPLNRYVSDKTGRHFEITRRLDVKLGRTTRILADGIEFANPEWARDPHLVKAESAEIDVHILPLLRRRIELPLIVLHKPQLGLQVEADGRRSWALGRDTADPRNLPVIGALVVDEGTSHYIATHHGADIRTDFAIDATAGQQPMPLTFKAKGTWQKETFTAQGRTGNVLYLSAPLQKPFPIEVDAAAGATTVKARGSIASAVTLDGADVTVNLQGRDMAELYKFIGVVLPATPRYSVAAHMTKQGDLWHARDLRGKLGNSDIAGELTFDRSQNLPLLTGSVKSSSLDFDDLAPLVGLPEQPRSAAALPQVKGKPVVAAARAVRDPSRKVLPTKPLDRTRLFAMNADVHYSAARVTHARQLPLDRMSLQAKLKEGVLILDQMKLGIAGGSVAGSIRIDGNSDPAMAETHLDARSVELNKLFPGLKATQASFGKIHGDIDLKGRGNSVAQMLGSSSGNVALLMGKGQVSNLLLEVAGLDGAEIIKFVMGGDQNVLLRCAAAAFDVKNGLMASRALVLDTDDTVIYGEGGISLSHETMDITMRPYPKDMSILSLRSPLKLSGTFSAPKAGVDKGAVAGRAGVALALGSVNPLLALAATIETGPGKDADCGSILREAASPYSKAKMEAMAQAQKDGKVLGGPGEPRRSFFQRLFGKKPAAPREVAPAQPPNPFHP
ncbi:MAG TPA: AsmA family protein [Ramlibacter sp.]|nr:AsmA family protein [Ramlibacter sp.]